ncbi:TSUP family transporter [Candidatus Litorirhabdus singularis]|uniref:TSUP family transporter n=1 Tax=Candidatus Litorirhabdus singularis TaxID=2518993 RepID=UPI00242FE20C|nr:TSUP family transporter [Candidatus Litorirhabdus singularis]
MGEYWLVLAAFLTSAFAGVFGMGGGVPLITLMPGVVPVLAIIPVHAMTQLASNGSRALFGWRHIDRSLILPFVVGGLGGAAGGGLLIDAINLDWLPILIGIVILVITWLPLPAAGGDGGFAMAMLGFYQTGVGMLVGATGPLGAALLARRNKQRDWLVVNTAVYMALNHLLKVLAFLVLGFSFAAYAPLIGGMMLAVIAGSWVGTRLRQYLPQGNFQFWFKLLVTILALRMILISLPELS